MQGLWRRLFTAILIVVIMLAGIFTGRYSFVILFGIICALCLWEFLGLTLDRLLKRDKIRKVLGLMLGMTPYLLACLIQFGVVERQDDIIALAAVLFSPFVFSVFIYELYTESEYPFANLAYIVMGVFYIGIPFALLDFIAFEGSYFYERVVFGLLLLTWVNDTGAYVVGSNFGRNKLFPRISPNKTWEGTLGGMGITLLCGFVLHWFFDEYSLNNWLVISLLVAIFGTLGDLVESMLKRSVGAKDSGRLLPGHGGVLDRFDAFIFSLPFIAAYILWLR